jgi:glycosyltransferase involved in cell wall biosynthesis
MRFTKYSVWNGSLDQPGEHGSFTVVAASIRKELRKRGIYTEDRQNNPTIICECIDTQRKFPLHIPLLASEYSQPPAFTSHWLKSYTTPILAISEFARQNLIRGGIDSNRIHKAHLGSDPEIWFPEDVKKFDKFTFLSVNSSNDRSAFDVLVPEFLKFAADKPNVQLIIKDGQNDNFEKWLNSFNSDKIIYIGKKYSQAQLRRLYNQSHCHVYYNNCTSFGMPNLDSVLCGIPNLATLGSAISEFTPEWTQTPYLVKTETKPLNSAILSEWRRVGLHTPPDNFYPPNTTREAIIPDNIVPSLNYAYENYLEMLKKNQEFQQLIKNTLGWDKTVSRILEVLENKLEI